QCGGDCARIWDADFLTDRLRRAPLALVKEGIYETISAPCLLQSSKVTLNRLSTKPSLWPPGVARLNWLRFSKSSGNLCDCTLAGVGCKKTLGNDRAAKKAESSGPAHRETTGPILPFRFRRVKRKALSPAKKAGHYIKMYCDAHLTVRFGRIL